MRSHLPPLQEIRAFEAVARLRSFHRAAEELHLTPSAVSHQVRSLEQFLGVSLFQRLSRQVVLTKEGLIYLPPVRAAIAQIRTATRQVAVSLERGPLVVCVEPLFASGWLLHRLAGFQKSYPDVELHIVPSTQTFDFPQSNADLAIGCGRAAWPDAHTHALMRETLVLVCSPALIRGPRGLKRPEDLCRVTLLHAVSQLEQWRTWSNAAGIERLDVERGLKFHDTLLAMEAAVAGLGAAIIDRSLARNALESGRLVAPFGLAVPSGRTYSLAYPEAYSDKLKVAAFRDWLLAEIALEGGK